MNFPLSLSDLGLLLAVLAIILLVTSELLASLPEFSKRIMLDKTRLRMAAIVCGIAFLVTVILRVI